MFKKYRAKRLKIEIAVISEEITIIEGWLSKVEEIPGAWLNQLIKAKGQKVRLKMILGDL